MFTGPFVFYDGIFEQRGSLAPTEESEVLQRKGDTIS
jgi:hypothetical protein